MNMVSTRVIAAIALLAGLGLGCSKGSSGPDPAGSAAPTEAKPSAKGIEAAGNDAAVVELAKKTLGCKWGTYGFDSMCPEMKALLESDLIREGKADATFVSFLEDPNEQVRWLGSRALSQRGKAFRNDKALAERILVVAEGEANKTVAQELGGVVGGIKHADTGLGERIQGMAKNHPVQQMRTSLLARMLFSNGETLYDFVKDIATNDKDVVVRKAAMSAFWTGTPPTRAAESCKMWLGFVDDAADDVSGEAAYLCSFYPQGGGCKAEWDPLLDKIEKRAKEGTIKSTQMASALFYLHRQPGASDAQKKRALAVARAILETRTNSGMARGRALELVAEKDPDGKKLLVAMQEDPDVFVKRRAKDLADKAGKSADEKAKAPEADKAKAPAADKAKTDATKKP
ncbi:hypothetical protein [Polyangium sorediatum]|uniref:HEAT repeat domain-containing protein n=1 Tax=Polyangium sorediatum TaxID=889274 RepID=A0ABT6P9W9_9BACT|nr:hypothetical protein [Polyangium sorediatum]MDI1437419.1 hypothetical protein [Polyangium sorediatum]